MSQCLNCRERATLQTPAAKTPDPFPLECRPSSVLSHDLLAMATRSRLFCVLLVMLAQAACGQKGPLYMEGHEPRGMKVVKPKNDAETAPQVEPSAPN